MAANLYEGKNIEQIVTQPSFEKIQPLLDKSTNS
jgi:hypothetical protein